MLKFITRPFSRTLRNVLIKQHPWFSCCASCSEIKSPVNHNICTSLAPDFNVDLVLMPNNNTNTTLSIQKELSALSLKLFLNSMPWIRKIFLIGYAASWLKSLDLAQEQLEKITSFHFKFNRETNNNPLNNRLISTQINAILNNNALSDCLLLATTDTFITNDFKLLDYFTPNGIPLNYLNKYLTENDLKFIQELTLEKLSLNHQNKNLHTRFFELPIAITKDSLKEIFELNLKQNTLDKNFLFYNLPVYAYILQKIIIKY